MQSVGTSHVLWAFIERLICNQYEHLMCYGRLLKAYMQSVRTSHVLWAFIEGLHAISTNISCVMGVY